MSHEPDTYDPDQCMGCEEHMDLRADDVVLWDDTLSSGPWHETCAALRKSEAANEAHYQPVETDIPWTEEPSF